MFACPNRKVKISKFTFIHSSHSAYNNWFTSVPMLQVIFANSLVAFLIHTITLKLRLRYFFSDVARSLKWAVGLQKFLRVVNNVILSCFQSFPDVSLKALVADDMAASLSGVIFRHFARIISLPRLLC